MLPVAPVSHNPRKNLCKRFVVILADIWDIPAQQCQILEIFPKFLLISAGKLKTLFECICSEKRPLIDSRQMEPKTLPMGFRQSWIFRVMNEYQGLIQQTPTK